MCVQFISKAKINISESMYYGHFILAFRGENKAQLHTNFVLLCIQIRALCSNNPKFEASVESHLKVVCR